MRRKLLVGLLLVAGGVPASGAATSALAADPQPAPTRAALLEPPLVPVEAVGTPLPPTGLTLQSGDRAVLVRWNAQAGVDGTRIERAASSTGPFSTVATVPAGQPRRFIDENVENNTAYWYRLRAIAGDLVGDPTAAARARPIKTCGTLPFDTRWRSGSVHVRCDIVVPSGVTLTIDGGAIGKFAGANGLRIEKGGALVVQPGGVLTSHCDNTIGGRTAVDGCDETARWSATLVPGARADISGGEVRRMALWLACATCENTTRLSLRDAVVRASTLHLDEGSYSIIESELIDSFLSFSRTDRPVVRGLTTRGGPPTRSDGVTPVRFSDVGDLSGVRGNYATGSTTERAWLYERSTVTGNWRPDRSGPDRPIHLLDRLTVAEDGVLELQPGAHLKASVSSNAFDNAGTIRTVGVPSAADPVALTSICDSTVDGDTAPLDPGCSVDPAPRSWNGALRGGSQTSLSHSVIRHADISNCAYNCVARLSLVNSRVHNSRLNLHEGSHSLANSALANSLVSFSRTARPVVRGVTTDGGPPAWSGGDTPVQFLDVGDLSGVRGNHASGSAIERTWRYTSSSVRGIWRPDRSGGSRPIHFVDGLYVAPGAVLELQPGALLKNGVGSGIGNDGTIRTVGLTSAAEPAVLTNICDSGAGGDTASLDSSCTADPGSRTWNLDLRAGSQALLSHADISDAEIGNCFVCGSATLWLADGRVQDSRLDLHHGSYTLADSVFTDSYISFGGTGRPVVRGVRTVGGAPAWAGGDDMPVSFDGVGDLSAVRGNYATGSVTERTWLYSGSSVAGIWRPDRSGQDRPIHFVASLSVGEGAVLELQPGAHLKAASSSNSLSNFGTIRTVGTTSTTDPVILTSLCDGSVDGDTDSLHRNCAGGPAMAVWKAALGAGSETFLSQAIIGHAAISNCLSNCSDAKLWLADSRVHDSVLDLRDGTHGLVDSALVESSVSFFRTDRPVVRGVTTTGGAPAWTNGDDIPIFFQDVADLSSVRGNHATGSVHERVWRYLSSGVKGTWRPDRSGADRPIHLIDHSLSVDGALELQPGTHLKLGWTASLSNHGTVRTVGATSAADPVVLTSVCDSTVDGDTTSFGSVGCADGAAMATWDAPLSPSSQTLLEHVVIDHAHIEGCDKFCGTISLSLADSRVHDSVLEMYEGSHSLLRSEFADSRFSFFNSDRPIVQGVATSGRPAWESGDAVQGSFSSIDDLSGVAADNAAEGGLLAPGTWEFMHSSVPADRTWTLGTRITYDVTGINVGGTLNSSGAAFERPAITGVGPIWVTGKAVIKGATFTTATPQLFAVTGGELNLSDSRLYGTGGIGILAGLDATVAVTDTVFSGWGTAISANPFCTSPFKSVSVSSSTFRRNAFAISNCNKRVSRKVVNATGNSGLSSSNVTTHRTTCVWALPEPFPPPPSFPIGPIWDVDIGEPDAQCVRPGYVDIESPA